MNDSPDNDFFFNVGIDSIGFYSPKQCVNLTELAEIRNIDPDKYLKGLLTKEMRIPGTGEDIVSMAVKAGQHAIMRGNINPKEIDGIFLGTETMTFAVKSVSNILSEVLGVSLNCITQDVYNACAGETLAILNAIGLINNDIINKALIIGADICSYELKSPGEPTQGAAAAALVISKNPRIAAFSKKFGKFSANVTDFYRMPYEKYPVVFGKYSIDSYLRFQLGAFDDFFNFNTNKILPDYLVFHSPFAKLPLKNIQSLILNRWDLLKKILIENVPHSQVSFKPKKETSEYLDELITPILEKLRKEENLKDMEDVKNKLINSLINKLLPGLNVPMLIGNMYSASTWAQMIYMLENQVKENDIIYFGSYGSGATCISGMLKVKPGFKEIIKMKPTVKDYMEHKDYISIKEYERLRGEVDPEKVLYAEIEPYNSNATYFIEMSICEEGFIVSKLEGLNFCPEGRNQSYLKRLPLYAVVKSDPIHVEDEKIVLSETTVRVSQEVKKGDIVEYTLLRAGSKESAHCIKRGFLNWIPTYQPIYHEPE